MKKHCLRIQFHTKLHNFTRKWPLKMVRTLLSLTWSFSYFVFDVEFLERNTLKSVITFCFLQIRNRNGHTNNVKKVWFHIPFIWGTRLDLGSPQCSRALHHTFDSSQKLLRWLRSQSNLNYGYFPISIGIEISNLNEISIISQSHLNGIEMYFKQNLNHSEVSFRLIQNTEFFIHVERVHA